MYKILITDMTNDKDWFLRDQFDSRWIASRKVENLAKANSGKFYVYQIVENAIHLERI
jgi:hypothetical protein